MLATLVIPKGSTPRGNRRALRTGQTKGRRSTRLPDCNAAAVTLYQACITNQPSCHRTRPGARSPAEGPKASPRCQRTKRATPKDRPSCGPLPHLLPSPACTSPGDSGLTGRPAQYATPCHPTEPAQHSGANRTGPMRQPKGPSRGPSCRCRARVHHISAANEPLIYPSGTHVARGCRPLRARARLHAPGKRRAPHDLPRDSAAIPLQLALAEQRGRSRSRK